MNNLNRMLALMPAETVAMIGCLVIRRLRRTHGEVETQFGVKVHFGVRMVEFGAVFPVVCVRLPANETCR